MSTVFLAQVPAFAMTNDLISDDNTASGKVTSTGKKDEGEGTASPSSPETSQALVKQLFQRGYFVHAVRQDLFDPEYDLTLRAGSLLPITADISGMASAILSMLNKNQRDEAPEAFMRATGMGSMTTYTKNPDQFRPCIYFSLNCLVEGHAGFDLDTYNSVVFIPAHVLLPDVVNLLPSDTAVWRSEIKLRDIPGAVVMVPETQTVPGGLDFGLVKLKKYTGDMTEAVNHFLDKKTGMRITLHSAPEGQENLLDRAALNGVELGEPGPFVEYLDNPAISFGHEASPKHTGIGPCLKILNTLVNDFNEFWKIGALKNGVGKGPKYIKKYRVEPLVILGTVIQADLEQKIKLLGNTGISEHYESVEKPKIARALANLRSLVKHKQRSTAGKLEWNNRPYTAEVSIRLVDFPYEVAKRVFENEWLAPVREETELQYWFYRHIQSFYGVEPCDDLNTLENLKASAIKLRKKLDRGKFSWPYAQMLNTLMVPAVLGEGLSGFPGHYLQGLEALDVILPQLGFISIKYKGEVGKIQMRETLKEKGINFPPSFFKKGIGKMPTLVSPNPLEESY
jgi:hypothetical protein